MVNDGNKPSMVVLSPGPGNPTDFKLSKYLDLLIGLQIPVFGVCLGLQGIVKHFEGSLGILDYPMHGKSSKVTLTSSGKAEKEVYLHTYQILLKLQDIIPCME